MSEHYLVKGDQRIELHEETIFGRSDDCDVKLTEGHPSRRHAKVTVAADGVWVEDLGSVNGTFINDNEVTQRTRLGAGDKVTFDIESYHFESAVDDQATVMRVLPPDDEPLTVVRPISELPAATPEPPAAIPEPPPAIPEPSAATPEPPAATPQPPAATPQPPPATPQPPPAVPEPPAAVPEPPAEPQFVPKSWADPEYQDEQGTRMFSTDQLRAYAEGGDELVPQVDAGPHLAVRSGQHVNSVLQFDPDTSMWSVGSGLEHALVLSDAGVSAFHARIICEGDRWKLIDQMSANGTFINDQKTTVGFLTSGDRIRFGPVECIITLPEVGRRAKPTAQVAKRTTAPKKSNRSTWLIAGGVAVATIVGLAVLSQFL